MNKINELKIKDCFGNSIEVTDLEEAIRQAKMFVGWSESENDGGFKFPEYKLVPSSDQFGKPTIIKQETNSGKWVRQLLYWKYTLHQLLKLSSVSLFICLLLASKMSGQTDSARLKVTKARSGADRTYYWLKDMDTKEKYYTVCSCLQRHKEGEIVKVARKDIELFKKD